jgi:hypothetical protein
MSKFVTNEANYEPRGDENRAMLRKRSRSDAGVFEKILKLFGLAINVPFTRAVPKMS